MYVFYSALLAVWLLITLPYWLIQMGRHGKYRAGLAQRLGKVPSWLAVPSKPVIWVHAVSVGEVLAISGLVAELRIRFPKYRLVVSTTTRTGQKLARKRFGEDNVFYFPIDFAFAVRPYLQALAPQLIVIAETEFDLFLTQTEEDSRRLAEIGAAAQRIQISGNLKFDVSPPAPPPIVASLQNAFYQASAGPILVCGSTVDDEERLLLRAFENILASHPRAVMILAPRHPERFREVVELLEKLGLRFWRRSLWGGETIAGGVFFVDTIGELAALYSLGTLAFVGGSLVPRGAHNIIEPAQYGVPIIVGTHTENFRDVVSLFRAQNALKVVGPAELPLVFMELISDEAERLALGRRAADTIRAQQGATQRVLIALDALLERSAVSPGAGAQ